MERPPQRPLEGRGIVRARISVVGRVVREAPGVGARARGRVTVEEPSRGTRAFGRVVREAPDPGTTVLGRVIRDGAPDG
jgi:hypothetical protein